MKRNLLVAIQSFFIVWLVISSVLSVLRLSTFFSLLAFSPLNERYRSFSSLSPLFYNGTFSFSTPVFLRVYHT